MRVWIGREWNERILRHHALHDSLPVGNEASSPLSLTESLEIVVLGQPRIHITSKTMITHPSPSQEGILEFSILRVHFINPTALPLNPHTPSRGLRLSRGDFRFYNFKNAIPIPITLGYITLYW